MDGWAKLYMALLAASRMARLTLYVAAVLLAFCVAIGIGLVATLRIVLLAWDGVAPARWSLIAAGNVAAAGLFWAGYRIPLERREVVNALTVASAAVGMAGLCWDGIVGPSGSSFLRAMPSSVLAVDAGALLLLACRAWLEAPHSPDSPD